MRGWVIARLISKLKQVEREHLDIIEAFHRDIERFKEEEAKLKNAVEVLKVHSLHIPDDCMNKLKGYEEQIRILEERLRHEKMLLSYLHGNVLFVSLKKKVYSHDLLLIVLATLIIDAAILLLSFDAVRIIGVPLLLIFPGYALLAVIFPQIEQLNIAERTAFSLCLSIAVMLLLSFGLNGSSLGAHELLLALTVAIFVCCGIAMLRRSRKLNFAYAGRGSEVLKWQ